MDEQQGPASATTAVAVRARLPAAGALDHVREAPRRPVEILYASEPPSALLGAALMADDAPLPGAPWRRPRLREHRASEPRRAGQAAGETERRLAALAFLDVAGYSRLMAADEAATLRRWLALRGGVVEPRVSGWRGRVVDRAGDGLFVEFRSVLDAVRWAFDVQSALAAAPAAVAEAPPLLVRVAVHLGDVIGAADGGVHGDAVNVAARLQEHAAPGGVVVSRAVHEQVRHALAYAAEDLGPLALKNMGRPVHGFRVDPAAPQRRDPASSGGVLAANAAAAPALVRFVSAATVSAAALLLVGLVGSLVAERASGAGAAWAAASGAASGLVSLLWAVRHATRGPLRRGSGE
jgi:adenylate cyclase